MLNKIAKQRLTRLANLVRTVPRKLFDLDYWSKTTPCGTTHCLGGFACLIPAFKSKGLKLIFDAKNTIDAIQETKQPCELYNVAYNGEKEFYALAYFFHIDACEAKHIFGRTDDEDGPLTPKQAAKRIFDFIKEQEGALCP